MPDEPRTPPRGPRQPRTGRSSARRNRDLPDRNQAARGQRRRPGTPPPRRPRPSTINRREAIALGGVLALGGAVAGGIWLATRDDDGEPEVPATATAVPTDVVAVSTPGTPAATEAPLAVNQIAGEQALVETSIADLSGWLSRREVTSAALVEAATSRYTRYDTLYRAMIEMNPDAPAIAQALDEELARGESRGPLHGMPVVVKDVIATGDQMLTTSGALALERNAVVEDARIVRRLREAGAVILGKANMTEWSNVRSGGQVSGWSDRGGQARNPYDSVMSTWGSSSGSAAAVALNYAPFALGVETNGSIVCPAAACGIVGLKPTVGLVSRVGVMPVSYTWDSPGPMARTVADVAAVMNVIAGFDPDDPAYGELGWSSPASTVGGSPVHEYGAVDYTAALDPNALRGARLGICWQMWGIDPDADEVAWAVIDQLIEAGAEIVESVVIPPLVDTEMTSGSGDMVNAEFASGMRAFFKRFTPEGPMMSLLDVAEWNVDHADEVLDGVGQEGLTETEGALALDDPEYIEILSRVTTSSRQEGVDAAMDEHELDAFIAPTVAVPREIDSGEAFPGSATKASAISGYPAITIPMGYVRGLPVGLYLAGRAFSDERLLALAYSIEQLIQVRVPAEP